MLGCNVFMYSFCVLSISVFYLRKREEKGKEGSEAGRGEEGRRRQERTGEEREGERRESRKPPQRQEHN